MFIEHFLQSEEILLVIGKRNAEHRTSKKYVNNLRINHSQKLCMLLTYISQEFNSVSTYCILRVCVFFFYLGRLEMGQPDGYTLHRVLVFSEIIHR